MGLEDLRKKQDNKIQDDYDEYQEFLRFKEMKYQNVNATPMFQTPVVEQAKMSYTSSDIPFIILALIIPLMVWSSLMNSTGVLVVSSIIAIFCYALDLNLMTRRGMGRWIYWGLLFLPAYVFLRISHTTRRHWPSILMCVGLAFSLMIGFGWRSLGNVANNSFKTGFSTSKANKMSIDEFKAACKEYEYKDILRNPSEYAGKYVKVTVGISNELNNMKGYWSALTATAIGWFGDQYVIHYDLDTKILPDDVITVYGVCEGTMDVVSVLGVQTEVPLIKARAVDLLTDDEAEKFVSDAYDEYLGDALGEYFGSYNQSSADDKSETKDSLPVEIQNVINNNSYIGVASATVNSEGYLDYDYNGQRLDYNGDFSSNFRHVLAASKGIKSKKDDLSVSVGEHLYILAGSADAASMDNGNLPWTLAVLGNADDIQNGSYSCVWLTITNEDGSEFYWNMKDDGLNFMLKNLIDAYDTKMQSLT